MNKNIKTIVAMVLVIGAVSAVAATTSTNLLTTRAYASTNDKSDLTSLDLLDSSGNKIKLYDSDMYDKRVHDNDVEDNGLYYAKTSSNTVNIDIDGPSKKYVRIFKGSTKTTQGKKVGEDIRLAYNSSTTILIVKVYGEDPGDNVNYDDDDNYDLKSTYRIKVNYTASDSSTSSDISYSNSSQLSATDYDSIYLDRMSIDGNGISLINSKIDYSYDVNNDVEQVAIRAVPEDKDTDKVEIDNTEVDDADNYKKTVSLKNGENKIKIDLTNEDDEERVYTLTINRGNTSATTESTNQATSNSSTNTDTVVLTNKWVQVNGKWQYRDAAGNTVKNSWIQNYYLQADGNMATGWLDYNGSKYYLGSDGAKKTGWQLVDGSWYYFK